MKANTTQAAGCLSHLTAELDLTSDELQKMQHMVGATKNIPKRQHGYRNYYASSVENSGVMENLLKKGLVFRGKKHHIGQCDYYYHATEKGCKAIGLTKAATKQALEDW